jgi:hypothetical protein
VSQRKAKHKAKQCPVCYEDALPKATTCGSKACAGSLAVYARDARDFSPTHPWRQSLQGKTKPGKSKHGGAK